ncbi:MAG: hypothetical protein ACAH88_21405, partial [Roseimicrobium sp.]
LICRSCNGQMYVPQVQQGRPSPYSAAASPQQPVQRKAAPPIKARSSKQSLVTSDGISVTLIILAIIVIGGGGLTFAGYLVYKASQDRLVAQEQRKAAAEAAALEKKKQQEEETATPKIGFTSEPTKKDILALRRTLIALQEAGEEADEDFREALEDAGIQRLLAAERVAKDTDFRESHKIIAEVRDVIDVYRKESRIPMDQWVGDVDAIKFEGIEKEEFMKRVRALRLTFDAEMDKIWDLQTRIVDQYAQAIKHLETTRGSWKLEGDSLAFNEVKDAERYKQFFSEVDKHSQKQFDMLQKYVQQAELTKGWLEQ